MGKPLDLIGQRFGHLTVIEFVESKNKKRWWRCKCDCGNEKITDTGSLRSGNTKSCGCMKHIGLIRYNQEQSDATVIPLGTRFGKLTVIEDVGFKTQVEGHKRRTYKCRCDCGKIIELSGNRLKTGNTKSCGNCLSSIGELNIIKILDENNIIYDHDTYLAEFVQEHDGHKYRFDFIVYDNKNKDHIVRIIEFDGRQHIDGPDTTTWGNTTDTLEQIQEKDKIKNDYCLKHNYPLVRIPYWKRDNMTYNDLFGDKYLVKG